MGCNFSDYGDRKIQFDPATVTTNIPEGHDFASMPVINPIIRDCAILSKSGRFCHRNKLNQDRVFLHFDEANHVVLFGVFDGHGDDGHIVSNFIKNACLHYILSSKLYPLFPIDAMTKALDTSEVLMKKKMEEKCRVSGTTALLGLIKDTKLYTINVGDSRSFYQFKDETTGKICTAPISLIHSPDDEKERVRILEHKGYVKSIPTVTNGYSISRVFTDPYCLTGGLAMSRSIGDFDLHQFGVISEPDIYELDLKEKNVHAILFGSDGLTTCFGADNCFARLQSKPTAYEGLQKLIRDCFKTSYESSGRFYVDDMSGIYIEFNH